MIPVQTTCNRCPALLAAVPPRMKRLSYQACPTNRTHPGATGWVHHCGVADEKEIGKGVRVAQLSFNLRVVGSNPGCAILH